MQLRHEYAQKPPQADPIEEDLRISAIETMETLKFEDDLHKTWYPIAKRLIGETYAPSPLDEELRNNIYAITTMSPIIAHSGDAWVRSRGLYYTVALNRSASSGHFIAGTKPSVLLGDIALGLQGRTTSRIEDEPVCLCALLGLDNTKVLQIPVPGPKEKRILSSINSRPTIAGLCRGMGFNASGRSSRCHEQRMRTALELLDTFPPGVVFWNVPRLRQPGWRWAPSTLLGQNTDTSSLVTARSARRDEGLDVSFPGWRIKMDRGLVRKVSRTTGDIVLAIDAELQEGFDHHPFRRSWLRSRLRGPRNAWRRYFDTHHDVALIVDGNKGILAAVVREAEGVVFTLFRATVERVLSEESIEAATVFSGRATWIAYPKWCVG